MEGSIPATHHSSDSVSKVDNCCPECHRGFKTEQGLLSHQIAKRHGFYALVPPTKGMAACPAGDCLERFKIKYVRLLDLHLRQHHPNINWAIPPLSRPSLSPKSEANKETKINDDDIGTIIPTLRGLNLLESATNQVPKVASSTLISDILRENEEKYSETNRPYCNDCQMEYPSMYAFVTHQVREKHGFFRTAPPFSQSSIPCPVTSCLIRSPNIWALRCHLDTHIDEQWFEHTLGGTHPSIPKDTLSTAGFDDTMNSIPISQLGLLKDAKPKPAELSCDVLGCQMVFTTALDLHNHKISKHKPPPVQQRSKETRFYCNKAGCTYFALDLEILRQHSLSHGESPSTSTRAPASQSKRSTVTSNPSKQYRCMECQKDFETADALNTHVRDDVLYLPPSQPGSTNSNSSNNQTNAKNDTALLHRDFGLIWSLARQAQKKNQRRGCHKQN